MHQHIIFHTIHAIQFKQIHMDIFGPTRKPVLFLTVPKNSAWDSPLINLGSTSLESKSAAISGLTTPKTTIYMLFKYRAITHKYNTHIRHIRTIFFVRDKSGTAQNESQKLQQFSPKFWDWPNGHSRPHTIQTINKALKPKINQVGEDPYLPDFSKLHKTGAHA